MRILRASIKSIPWYAKMLWRTLGPRATQRARETSPLSEDQKSSRTQLSKILIVNAWSYDNKGDATMLAVTIKILRQLFPTSKIDVMAFHPKSFEKNMHQEGIGGIEFLPEVTTSPIIKKTLSLRPISLLGPLLLLLFLSCHNFLAKLDDRLRKMLDKIERADLVISCGRGGSFRGRSLFVKTLFSLLYAKLVAKKKTVILGQTIGPIVGPWSFLARFFLRKIDLIIVREPVSYRYVQMFLGDKCSKNIWLGSDLAFWYMTTQKYRKISRDLGKPKKLGITIKKSDNYHNFISEISDFLDHCVATGIKPFIILISRDCQIDDDFETYLDITEAVLPGTRDRVALVDTTKLSVEQVIDQIREMDLMICTRYHSAVFASIAETPFVWIVYEKFRDYGLSEHLQFDPALILEYSDVTAASLSDLCDRTTIHSPRRDVCLEMARRVSRSFFLVANLFKEVHGHMTQKTMKEIETKKVSIFFSQQPS